MKRDYFIYNEKQYCTGTKIKIRVCNNYGMCPITARFIEYDTNTKTYYFEDMNGVPYKYSEHGWNSFFLCVYGEHKKANTDKEYTFDNELNIDGMINAWLWYIVLIAISTILKGNVFYWVIISYVFFKYRNEKLRKAGYKK